MSNEKFNRRRTIHIPPQSGNSVKSGSFGKLLRPAGFFVILLTGFIIYSNSFDCSFHADDEPNILLNKAIKNIFDLKAIWRSGGNRPVATLTFALNYHFGGFEVRGWHYFNLAIHLMNAFLVWWLSALILVSPAMSDNPMVKYRREIAFFCALLFVTHPLATQSVTYIVQRMNSMAAMFYLLAVSLYVSGRIQSASYRYVSFAGALISGILAVLSKENAFTLPLAIVLVEIFFLQTRSLSLNFKDRRIMSALIAISAVLLTVPQKFSFNIFNPIPPSNGHLYTVTPINYLMTQFSVIPRYLSLILFPFNQNWDYDYPIAVSLFEVRTILGFLALAGLLALAVYLFSRERVVSFGIFWFFITLSVESGIIPITDLIFEHRTYLPSFGILVALASFLFGLFPDGRKKILMILLIMYAGMYSVLTYQRNKVWKDDLSLMTDVTKKSPNKARPFGALGDYYRDKGLSEKSIAAYSRAIKNNPDYATALHNRGTVYSNMNKWNEAIADFSRAIGVDTGYYEAYMNRGMANFRLGLYDRAVNDYSKAIELSGGNSMAFSHRGISFYNLRQYENAVADCTKAIEKDPENASAYNYRGVSYYGLGQWSKAMEDYGKAMELDPKFAEPYSNRGLTFAAQDQWEQAINDYSKAIGLDPKFINAYRNRGSAFMKLRQWDRAAEDFSAILEISPGNVFALNNRAVAYGNLGQWGRAVTDYDKAIEIDPNNGFAISNRQVALGRLKKK